MLIYGNKEYDHHWCIGQNICNKFDDDLSILNQQKSLKGFINKLLF